jgi:hypothetical protein
MDTLMRATLREAREMGVLIAEPGRSREGSCEPSHSSAGSIVDDAGEPAPYDDEPPTRGPTSPQPKLVPITHRRQ